MSAAEQRAAFEANVDVGTCGSGSEQGLESMLRAVSKACNAGFLRPQHRATLTVTDDPAALLEAFAAYTPPSVGKWLELEQS